MMVVFGSIWGLSEAALGMGLRSCAAIISGSIMTGIALFFIAAGWTVSRRIFGMFLMVLMASLFKMFDALLLSRCLDSMSGYHHASALDMNQGDLIRPISWKED